MSEGEQVVVESGLNEGERIIVEGIQKVRPGMAVAVSEAQPATPTPPRARASQLKAEP